MFEIFRKTAYLNALLLAICLPFGMLYFIATIYMAMEKIYNVMVLTIFSSMTSFIVLLLCVVAILSLKRKFAERSQYRFFIDTSNSVLVGETCSQVTVPSMSSTTTKYKILDCDENDYDLATGIVFSSRIKDPAEFIVITGADVRGSLDNKIFLSGNLFYEENKHEWSIQPDFDFEDEQKAYMSIMIRSLGILIRALRKVIMNSSDEIGSYMQKVFSFANRAYDMIVPIKEEINIPVVQGKKTSIEQIRASSKGSLDRKQAENMKAMFEQFQKIAAERPDLLGEGI